MQLYLKFLDLALQCPQVSSISLYSLHLDSLANAFFLNRVQSVLHAHKLKHKSQCQQADDHNNKNPNQWHLFLIFLFEGPTLASSFLVSEYVRFVDLTDPVTLLILHQLD